MSQQFKNFKEFYPYYLSEHKNPTTRLLHFIGTSLVLISLLMILLTNKWTLLWILPIWGYTFAWVGHFFFEKNKPATFKYPIYSFIGDWVMYYELLTGKQKF